MKKKIIVHVTNSVIYSGLEKVACEIINNFNNEYEMIYVTKDGVIVDNLKKMGIRYFIIEKMSIGEIKRMIRVLKPDIIHAHDFRASVITSLASKSIPVISHLHNNCPWLKKLHPYSLIYLLCSFKFKKILTVSGSIGNEYIFRRFINKKILCIKNPLSCAKIMSCVNVKSKFKKYDICCVGRVTKQKNPIRFIQIISKLKEKMPNIKAIWVGDGELLDNIKNMVKKLDLSKNIEFVGFKNNPYEYINLSKIFMLTSSWEGFGLVAFEALTLGVPAVVSNVGGLCEIVDDKCGGVLEKDNEFVNLAYTLLNDNSKYSTYSNNANIKAKKLENYKIYMQRIRCLYEEFY